MAAVLLAFDNTGARTALARTLTSAGHMIAHVTDFRLAMDGADFTDVEMVIVDLDQQVRREEFIRSARHLECTSPIIAIGEELPEWQVQRLESLGAQLVMPGPAEPHKVVAEVARLLPEADRGSRPDDSGTVPLGSP